jgi:uncharacterized protein YhbP (UPF0306 family)
VPIERPARRIAARRLESLARSLLDASTLCAISTVSPGGTAHVNTAYFASTAGFDLVWLSEPGARHSRNLEARATAAVAVFDSGQTWGEPDRGIQLFGRARAVADAAAERAYAARFPAYDPRRAPAYHLYRFRPSRVKLFDERELGSGVFVTARVGKGRLTWQRTEVYRAGASLQ